MSLEHYDPELLTAITLTYGKRLKLVTLLGGAARLNGPALSLPH